MGPVAGLPQGDRGNAVGTVLTTGAFQMVEAWFLVAHHAHHRGGIWPRNLHRWRRQVEPCLHVLYRHLAGQRCAAMGGSSKGEALAISAVANAGTAYLIELFDGYSKKTLRLQS